MSEQTNENRIDDVLDSLADSITEETKNSGKKSKNKNSDLSDPVYPAGFKKDKPKRKLIIGIFLLLLVGLIIFRIASSHNQEATEKKVPVSVKTTTAQMGDLNVTTPLAGTISAEDEASVIAMLQSNVTNVYVSVGDYVTKGTVLFTQDTSTLQGSVGQASAAISMAQENVASAKNNFDRMAILYNEGGVSRQQYEAAETQYKTAQASLAQAEAGMTSANSAIANGTATAPISGYVTAVNVVAGAYPAQAPAVSIANTGSLKIKTNISEYLVGKINAGDKVSVVARSYSEEPFEGVIKTIAPAPSGGLTYPIEISLVNPPEAIRAGMFAEVNLVSDSKQNVLLVPSDAVIIKSSQTKAVVLDKDNVPKYVDVTTGLDNGKYVEIVSGLKSGDTVVVEGQHYIVEGEKVRVQKQK